MLCYRISEWYCIAYYSTFHCLEGITVKLTNLKQWPERKVQQALLSFRISWQKWVMPQWFRALLYLLAEPSAVLVAVPPWSGAGDQPQGVLKCITVSVPNAECLSWWFSISAKYKDNTLSQHKNKVCILDKKAAPNGNNSFSQLFGTSITQESITYQIPNLAKNIS